MTAVGKTLFLLLLAIVVCDAKEMTPRLALLSAEEGSSAFAAKPLSGWARMKFVSVAADQKAWLSFGGEGRVRYEYYHNEGWSDALNDDSGYLLTRTYLHGDVHRGPFRFFGQLQSSLSEGRRGGPGPIDEDRFDVQQAFVSWTGRLTNASESVEVRLGRHEVQYGSGRLIAARAGANTRQAFDGGLMRLKRANQRTDFFWLSPVDTHPRPFDNDRKSGRFLAGAYATFNQLPVVANADVYMLLSREPERAYVNAAGRERRWSVGVRPWGKSGPWDYNVEFVAQFGEFAGESIRAWTAASDVGLTWRSAKGRPRFGLKANVASGDRAPADDRRETFNALFPKAAYFGEISQVVPSNLLNLHPSVTVQATNRLTLTLDAVVFWRAQMADGIYGPNLRLERGPSGSNARHIGNQFDVLLSWRLTPFVAFDASAAVFTAGKFLDESGPSRTVRYFNVTVTFTF